MKKLSILALTLILVVGLLTGCRTPMNDDGTEGSAEDTVSTTKPVTGTTGITTPTLDITLPSATDGTLTSNPTGSTT